MANTKNVNEAWSKLGMDGHDQRDTGQQDEVSDGSYGEPRGKVVTKNEAAAGTKRRLYRQEDGDGSRNRKSS